VGGGRVGLDGEGLEPVRASKGGGERGERVSQVSQVSERACALFVLVLVLALG
jgi:hypothetical protein